MESELASCSRVSKDAPLRESSGVTEECFEAVVHVLLDVAVEEGEAGLIGGEVDYGAPVVGDDYGVLDDASGLFPVDLDQLPQMPVQVHGVGVVGAVAHHESVARALLQHELLLMWVGLAVDQPGVELSVSAGDLLEDHFDGLLRSG